MTSLSWSSTAFSSASAAAGDAVPNRPPVAPRPKAAAAAGRRSASARGWRNSAPAANAWPSATEFKQAGRFDLYVAASRYGGIRFWTSELGLTREPKPVPPATAPRRRRFRPRLQWVPAAAVAALALALAGGGHIQLSTGGAVVEAAAPQLLAAPSLKPPSVRPRAQHAGPARHARPAARPARTTPAQASTATSSTQLAAVSIDRAGPDVHACANDLFDTCSDDFIEPGAASRASGGSPRRPLPPPPPGS